MLKFITGYKVFPHASDVGIWSLWIETPYSVGPLGPRFCFGGHPPDGGFDFNNHELAVKKSEEWMKYFREVAKRSK